MEEFAFCYTKENHHESIFLCYENENCFTLEEIGDTYNLIDYITNCPMNESRVSFIGFKGNQITKISSYVARRKDITNVLNYNSFIISDKKSKIRGKKNDKLDSRADRCHL